MAPGRRGTVRIRSTLLLLLTWQSHVTSFTPSLLWRSTARSVTLASSSQEDDPVVETLNSLVDFHQGSWTGIAKSFTVTNDVMAGVVQRKVSSPYSLTVQLGRDDAGGYRLTETLQEVVGTDGSTKDGLNSKSPLFQRKLSIPNCQMDVDSVDASYSLDAAFPDFPSALSGCSKGFAFGIEHCLATSENSRSRCFVFYGTDEDDDSISKQLSRIVVCHEERMTTPDDTSSSSQMTMSDFLEIQSDIDRLVDKVVGSTSSKSTNGATPSNLRSDPSASESPLTRHLISLLELSSGIWNGDVIIRDVATVSMSPLQPKGFGAALPERVATAVPFCWTMGVAKLAWRWMWNFGDEIRAVRELGRGMGATLATPVATSLAGSVCVNEGLSRRIPKEDRMVYIDWDEDNVGFLCDSTSIQVPRWLTLDSTSTASRRLRPMYTEFAVYQASETPTSDDTPEGEQLPELVCSKIARLYNYEGKLKQGVSSFFTLQRFGLDD